MAAALELLVNETVDSLADMNVKMIVNANGNCAKLNHFGFITCSTGGSLWSCSVWMLNLYLRQIRTHCKLKKKKELTFIIIHTASHHPMYSFFSWSNLPHHSSLNTGSAHNHGPPSSSNIHQDNAELSWETCFSSSFSLINIQLGDSANQTTTSILFHHVSKFTPARTMTTTLLFRCTKRREKNQTPCLNHVPHTNYLLSDHAVMEITQEKKPL